MRRIQALVDRSDDRFDTTRRVRRLIGAKIRRGKRSADDALRNDAALAGSFAAGVLVGHLRHSRRAGESSNAANAQQGNGVQWASVLVRAALPYAIHGLSASSAEVAPTPGEHLSA